MEENNKLSPKPNIISRSEDDVGLLFNPDTGRVNLLNETAKFIWSCLEQGKNKSEITQGLMDEFAVPDRTQLGADIDRFLGSLGKFGLLKNYPPLSKVPHTVCFGITSRCNLNCKHCLNRDPAPREPDLGTEEILSVIDQMGNGGTKNISLFGGEPLCHPDFKKIVERINLYPINLSLNTNATLIDKEMAGWLKAHRINGAVVSFDGSNAGIMDSVRGAGAWQTALKGIAALKEEGLRVLLSATLTKLNYQDVREMIRLGKSINADSLRFNHVFFAGNAVCFLKELYLSPQEEKSAIDAVWRLAEEFPDFINPQSSYLSQKKKLDKMKYHSPSYDKITVPPCGAANGKCAIRPDGWIVPCEIIWEVKCGSLRKNSLSEIWQGSELLQSFREPMVVDLKEIPECIGCGYQYLCFLGHRCYPYYNPGGITNRQLYCWKKK